MADQLCTTAQVKTRLFPNGVTSSDDDTLISELIDQVSAWMQSYTGRKLVPENAATYVLDTKAGSVLRIARGLRTVSSMGAASTNQPDTAGTYTAVTAADILLRPKAVDLDGWPPTEVWLNPTGTGDVLRFYDALNGATITGNWGFASTPLDITSVAIDATVAAFQSRRNGASSTMGADDMAMPPWSKFFGRGSPQRGTLDRYRYPSV